jgi:hypothetical protein
MEQSLWLTGDSGLQRTRTGRISKLHKPAIIRSEACRWRITAVVKRIPARAFPYRNESRAGLPVQERVFTMLYANWPTSAPTGTA